MKKLFRTASIENSLSANQPLHLITKIAIFIGTLILIGSLITSCKKEEKNSSKPFKADYSTFYRIAPTDPQPVIVDNVPYIGFAYFPGGGIGNATHIGKSQLFFNQLAYTNAPARFYRAVELP